MSQKLLKWFRKFFKKEKLYKYSYVNDVPDNLKPGTIYIVGNEGFSWQIVMLCPCNCKKVLHMNLMKEHHPYWRVEINRKNLITLHPSVHRMVGCKSHFFVRKGKIVWT